MSGTAFGTPNAAGTPDATGSPPSAGNPGYLPGAGGEPPAYPPAAVVSPALPPGPGPVAAVAPVALLAPPPAERGPAGLSRRARVPSAPPAPGRRLVIGSLIAAVAGGSLLGLVVGIVAPAKPPAARVITTAAPTQSPTAAANAIASPSRSARPSPSVPVKTVRATEAAPPADHIAKPWTDRSLQFVTLEDIQRGDGGTLRMRVTTTTLLSGGRARAFYERQGQEPREFAADPSGGRMLELTVRPDATVFGEFYLGNHTDVNVQRFSIDDLFNYARGALDHGRKPTFWLQRSLAIEGPVIYVGEQYVG